MRSSHYFAGTAALFALAHTASAQAFDNEWVAFERDDTAIIAGTISDSANETDFRWGDLDQDGFTDLVIVRKQPFTSPGKRTNILLMNEGGVLTDRSAEYASAADVPGDMGFLTATNDRDVILSDVDNDGWLDVVTATTISDGDPKHIGHPRIYMNLGNDGSGNWLGLRFEDARVPQFIQYTTLAPENPRFCSVAAGDVTGDGFADLYFGDYDSSGAGGSGQPANKDLNDRLLINDGTGHFVDESQTRMTSAMLLSAFGNSVVIEDMNLDGKNDIVKDTALNFPQRVSVSYNNPANEGTFQLFDPFHDFAPYHTEVGDLNNDGRPDVLISDDGLDRYRYNLSTDPLGRVVWSDAKTFAFLSGGDDGFGSNNLVADIDGDGWNDALVADVDVDIGGYNRRLHIYHNPGGAPGSQPTLIEERQGPGNGWVGVKGMTTDDLRGTHDMAVFDIDNDGDNDMVISRLAGTAVWKNVPTEEVCQPSIGFQGPGTAELSLCGTGLGSGQNSTLRIESDQANSLYVLGFSNVQAAVPFLGGTLVPFPLVGAPIIGTTNGVGVATIPVSGGVGSLTIYLQALVRDPAQVETFQITNAIQATFQP